MSCRSPVCFLPLALLSLATCGCHWVPKSRLTACESQSRAMVAQGRAQTEEIENIKVQLDQARVQLARTEEDLSLMEDELGNGRQRLAAYQRERNALHSGFVNGGASIPPQIRQQLQRLAERYPGMHFDPDTGISKLDTDILFNSGEADLLPDARQFLDELGGILRSADASELRLMVVGHTDDRGVAKRSTRQQFRNNWHLSAARSLEVVDHLRQTGIPDDRLGVAGFADHQPIVPNTTEGNRHRNRRVEIFVLGPETPLVGRTDSIPNLY